MERRRMLVGCGVALMAAMAPALLAQAPGQYTNIDFFKLGNYDYNTKEPYEPTPLRSTGTIPREILALSGKKIAIQGNAMALDWNSGQMSEFILNPTVDSCAFGATPRINEWIYVKMPPGKKTQIWTGIYLTVRGTFRIEEQVDKGRVVGLYSIEADDAR